MDREFIRQYVAGRRLGLVLVSRWIDPLGGSTHSGHSSVWRTSALGDRALSRHDIADQDGKSSLSLYYNCPAAFYGSVTFSAGYMKIFSPDPNLGLLASGV